MGAGKQVQEQLLLSGKLAHVLQLEKVPRHKAICLRLNSARTQDFAQPIRE
jgi:hypothetical protein